MTLALLAALVIVSGFAVLQHITIKRLAAPLALPEPEDSTEAGLAVLDVVEASLSEHPEEWDATDTDLLHQRSGFRVRVTGKMPRLFKNGLEIALPEGRPARIMHAIAMGNARDAVAALTPALSDE